MRTIRPGTREDLPRIMEIYARARTFMAAHGNPNQWGESWPPKSLIEQDIAQGHCYVCDEDGRTVAVFYYNYAEDPYYRKIEDGAWIGDEDYAVVHRIAADGAGKGIGSFCLSWAFQQHPHLRMDTHGDNKVMQGMLTKNGFRRCGTVHVPEDDMPRIAFEKIAEE